VFLQQSTITSIEALFQRNFEQYQELGASLSLWQHGEEILNLAAGYKTKEKDSVWDIETLIPVYSATKGPAAATLLMVLAEHGLTIDHRVTDVWAAFPNKQATFAHLLSHQAGLSSLDQRADVYAYGEVISAIENQDPAWQIGEGHGYHPRTFGFLLDECARNITRQKIDSLFTEKIAKPLDIHMWIGLPEAYHPRVGTLYPGKMDKSDLQSGFYKEFNTAGTLVQKSFSSPAGLRAVHEMNDPKAWSAGFPAMGGVATASALAKFYQAAIGEINLFSQDVLEWMRVSQIMGDDKVLKTPTHFTCGFQKDPIDPFGQKIRQNYGISTEAFGHPGAGGSHAFGDPVSGISFAYTMNQMELSVLPGAKSLDLVKAIF